jgi:hypothetical protein
MCTALLSIEPGLPTLLVGVRDELAARSWEPPGRHWPELPGLIGGRDLQAGGTWLAVSPQARRVGCVLNGRGQPAKEAARQSRGVLPLRAASGEPLDATALASFDPFHLLTAEPDRALIQSWDGQVLIERELAPGLYFAVNSGLAGDPGGLPHETARIRYFLPRFQAAARPHPLRNHAAVLAEPAASRTEPATSRTVAAAWGDWLALVNGDGLDPADDRALILRRELGDGRVWGTTSISLVALSPAGLRYDFTGSPGNPAAWYAVC